MFVLVVYSTIFKGLYVEYIFCLFLFVELLRAFVFSCFFFCELTFFNVVSFSFVLRPEEKEEQNNIPHPSCKVQFGLFQRDILVSFCQLNIFAFLIFYSLARPFLF